MKAVAQIMNVDRLVSIFRVTKSIFYTMYCKISRIKILHIFSVCVDCVNFLYP